MGFAERLIGLIRHEFLDRLIVLNEADLRQFLEGYANYYNKIRTRRSPDKDAPAFHSAHQVGTIASHAILGGLHHHYVRI